MKDRAPLTSAQVEKFWPDRGIFQGAARAYIRFCETNPPSWLYLEKLIWSKFLSSCTSLDTQKLIDIGAGAGKLTHLLSEHGVNTDQLFALEPNPILAVHLRKQGFLVVENTIQSSENPISNSSEFDLLTANMVINHLSDNQFTETSRINWDILKLGGMFAYTIPYPEGKARKYGLKIDSPWKVDEPAPWGGNVQYNHRSTTLNKEILESVGFSVSAKNYGFHSFNTTHMVSAIASHLNKTITDPCRTLIIAKKSLLQSR